MTSDGVIAIIITIMVLELKIPHGDDWHALRTALPLLSLDVLSFTFVGIYSRSSLSRRSG